MRPAAVRATPSQGLSNEPPEPPAAGSPVIKPIRRPICVKKVHDDSEANEKAGMRS